MTGPEIVRLLGAHRFPLSNEKRLQAAIDAALDAEGVEHRREVRLSDRDVIDFVIGDVGIEVKIRGGRREIYRQVERYAAHDRLSALVLVTNVPTGFPPQISGKPVYVLQLGMAWL